MYKYVIFIAFVVFAPALLFAQRKPIDLLPRPYQCGFLREKQFFNLQKTVEQNELTWMVHIIINNNTLERVMGVLIHEKYALAPAHPFDKDEDEDEDDPRTITLQLGSCLTEDTECVTIRKFQVIKHPEYISIDKDITSKENSIALIRFEEPVTFSRYISPVCLPSAVGDDRDYTAQHMTVAGTWSTGKYTKKFFVLVQSLTQCIRSFDDANSKFLCANVCDREANFAAGSALLGARVKNSRMDHYYLVAIAILDNGKSCDDMSPDIFVRIDHHVKWIVDTIFKQEKS